MRTLFGLHLLLALYSLSGILSKLASQYSFMSEGFIACYGGMILVLGAYALGWQQVIKRLPLTTAYANRAVTVIWGVIWGVLLFHEDVTAAKVIGAAIVLVGVILYATADSSQLPKSADDGDVG
ncbi:MAG: transporter [Atopobiaceae bacterium]|jgi:drug/metabolite transporter (DMT)-like permease|nr:transporter [Atopobiaceae bacterium]MCI2173736.1 transporter [Atopobiaceae bacterium]MCI2207622.1 transporter [Atopobiaceae bacterium]